MGDKDYITLGTTPAEEDCAQVGSDDYEKQVRLECERFVKGIYNYFGHPPNGAYLKLKAFPQVGYGMYYEVCVYYNVYDDKAVNYAYLLEGEMPGTWEELERVFHIE